MTESHSLPQAALTGNLPALREAWATASLKDQTSAFQLGCDQPDEAIPRWILEQASSAQMDSRQRTSGLVLAASRGHLATLKRAQAQQPWSAPAWTEITVRALLTQQAACVAWLTPQGSASDLFEDVMDNYDDAYKLSYRQAMAVLDQAGPHLSQADRTEWLDKVGRTSGLLPHTLEAERALNRQATLAERPPAAPGRSRVRP